MQSPTSPELDKDIDEQVRSESLREEARYQRLRLVVLIKNLNTER